MKALSLLLSFFTIFGTTILLNAASKDSSYETSTSTNKKIGDFLLAGFGPKKSVALSNNLYYYPTNKDGEDLMKDWALTDPIRLLRTKDWDRYVLLNLRTGESAKCKIYNWH